MDSISPRGPPRHGGRWRSESKLFRLRIATLMPLDSRAKRLLDALAAARPASALSLSVAQRRVALADLMSIGGAVERVAASEDMTLPTGTLVRVYTPADAVAAS